MSFIYRFSGAKFIVEMIQSAVLRYKLRVRMVPMSFKVFIYVLGLVTGVSGSYVYFNYENVVVGHITINNSVSIPTVLADSVKELTVEEKIAKTFPENPEVMIAVAKAESGLNPLTTNRNTNGSRDIGLFQINSVHGYSDLEMFDVDKNLVAARAIYDKQGITAWAAVNNVSYLKHIK